MGKTRVGVLLRESMGGNKSSNKSADLTNLTSKYNEFCKQIKYMIQCLKNHHKQLQEIEHSRQLVAKCFGDMTKKTPLYDAVGLMPSQDRPSNTVCSYRSVHDTLAAKTKSYSDKYQQFVLEYATEYEKVIRTRIDAGIKKADSMRIELDHYQKKTESLRLSANQAMAKGKPVSSAAQEKLTRNEEKLIASKQNYNKIATDLCILIEEVTDRNWRDLHPLLIKCSQFDMTLANDESKILGQLNQVVDSLKLVATDNGIAAQPRLKDLAGLKPELLSTRPGGVEGLTIEDGLTSSSSPLATMTNNTDTGGITLPPADGGYPLQVSPAAAAAGVGGGSTWDMYGSGMIGRSNSSSSVHSAPPEPSTLSMLTISNSAAPAPTLDDVYNSASSTALTPTNYYGNNHPSSARSAPSSGNYPLSLPPSTTNTNTTPTMTTGWNVRSSSFNDADSAYSGYSGAPPMTSSAPPPIPPPNMPPPPPPPGPDSNMYASQSYGAPPATQTSPWALAPAPASGGYNPNPTMSMYPPPAAPPAPPAPQQQQSSQGGYNPFG